jgi:sugar fermentation stimulation protein A
MFRFSWSLPMRFTTTLIPGSLIKRHKRFLADMQLADGTIVTAHCPNTGAMLTCSTAGSDVLLSRADTPLRKYPLTLEMVRSGKTWVGVNTARTNAVVAEALAQRSIKDFPQTIKVVREVTTSKGTRLDFLVIEEVGATYVEVKTCSLAVDGCAMFPDAVTERGSKHLRELMRLVAIGEAAAVFFLVTRMDAVSFSPARHIDPAYAKALVQAEQAGVRVLAYQARVTPAEIEVIGSLPVVL